MSKHAPGPWLIEAFECHSSDVATIYGTTNGWVSIYAPNWVPTDFHKQEQSANARLIAAAPDLLDLVEEFVERGISVSLVKRARTLIKKAKGETA